LSIMVSYTNAH